MNENWVSILKCPVSGQSLKALDRESLEQANSNIDHNLLWRGDGVPVSDHLKGGFVSEDGNYIYPVINEIVLLHKDLVIVSSPDRLVKGELNADKELVRNFYDQEGWFADEAGNYEDAVIYEDLRSVSKDYIRKCHDRVSRYIDRSGTYLLDVASGALQFDDYLQYSENYRYRVCVDFSFQALAEARKKLGDKGIYILADITNLPFKENTMDSFISLNTIYHIPKDEQVTAVNELYRVLLPGGKGVVVYDWYKHSRWMNISLLPFRGMVFIRNRFADLFSRIGGTKAGYKRLYFYAHPYEYFKKNLPPFKLKVWRSVSVPFLKYYIHPGLFGKQLLERIYEKEERAPETCGLNGEYPLFWFEKDLPDVERFSED